jgi:predicted DNA-binding protein (MmcQ/YjbR family)
MAGKLTGDDVFQRLFEYCGQKPGATVDHPWGEVVFKVKKKIFAYIGRPGESSGVTVKPAPEELEALLKLPNVNLAHYIGRYGWVNVAIDDRASMEMALRLVDETYEQIAHKKKPAPVLKTAAAGDAPAGRTTPPAARAGAARKSAASAGKKPAASTEKKSAASAEKKPAAAKKSGSAGAAAGEDASGGSGKKTAASSKRSKPKDDAPKEGGTKRARGGKKPPS